VLASNEKCNLFCLSAGPKLTSTLICLLSTCTDHNFVSLTSRLYGLYWMDISAAWGCQGQSPLALCSYQVGGDVTEVG
jgi:hypothetical protein